MTVKRYSFSIGGQVFSFSVDPRTDRRVVEKIDEWRKITGFNFSRKIGHLIYEDAIKQDTLGPHEYELEQRLVRIDQYYTRAKHGETIIMLFKSGVLNEDDVYNIYKSARLALYHIDWNRDIQQIVKDKMYEEKRGDRKTVEESR